MRRLVPPTLFFLSIGLMLLLRWLLPVWIFLPWPWSAIGLLPLLAGMALGGAGSRTFHRVGTTLQPGAPSSTLVTDGIYKFTRNPMYVGLTLALIGIGLLLGALTPLLVVLAFVVVIQRRFIALEEQTLTAQFGAAYTDYQRRVRRWL
jgi:protein-S-isoprenylcysteine O-methyltransferase Ste14